MSTHPRPRPMTTLLALCCVSVCLADEVKPLTKLKKLYLNTELARGGEPRASIYHPPTPEFQAAAQELSDAIKAKFGVALPAKPDDAQRTWRTGQAHILALGNMGNSLVLQFLNSRALVNPIWTERRLRTAHDPFAEGRNVVMLGGVDLERVKQNFQPLIERIQCPKPGTLVLPPTIDPAPTISDKYKAMCDKYRKELPRMPMNYPAYHAGWSGRYYAIVGHDDFVKLYRESLLRLAEKKSYCHLYLFREFAGWDLIEESPLLTDADRLTITSFFRDSVAHKKEGIGGVRRTVRSIRAGRLIQGNHPSQAACGVMVVADYLRRYYPSELHEKWYREALEFFDIYRDKGCYLGDDEGMQGSSISNIMTAVYRTEDNPADHPFLRNVLARLMPNYNNFGTFPAYGDMGRPGRFSAGWYERGAQLYSSPELLWMYHFIRTAKPDQAAAIPTGKPKPGWSTINLTPAQPANFVGLSWAEPDETLFSLASKDWAKTNRVEVADCFGRAAFRGGIGPQDDYLLLDGVHLGHAYDDQNGFLEYSSLGRTWLVSFDYCYGTPQSAHNVVSVSRDGMADPGMPKLAVRRLWADLPSFAATRTLLYPHGRDSWQKAEHLTSDWERNVLWLKNRFFVVFDRVVAREVGVHSAVGFWRMVGERRDLPNGIEMLQHDGDKEVKFRLTAHGVDSFALGREEDPQAGYFFHRSGPQNPPLDNVPHVIHMLKAHKARALKTGESFTMATCFWANSEQRAITVACESINENMVRVSLDGQPMLAACGPVTARGLQTDAALSLVAADRVCLVAARTLSIAGHTVFVSAKPVSFEWDFGNGQCAAIAATTTSVSFAGHTVSLPPGKSTHVVAAGDIAASLAAAIRSLPSAKPSAVKHLPAAPARLAVAAKREGDSAVECLWTGRLGSADSVLVGRRDGAVERLSSDALGPLWTYHCKGVVNSIDAGDTTGSGAPEIAVGSDDHQLHVLSPGGKRLWTWDPPFDELKARIAYKQWLWSEPFVKRVAVHDITGDGKAEIVVGAGMNTFGVNSAGKQLWAFNHGSSHHPTMMAIAFADVDGDGKDEPIGGASDMWYHGSPSAIGPKGEKLVSYPNDGWVSGVKVILAEDIEGKGATALIYGTRANGLRCCSDVRDNDYHRSWYRKFADLVDQVTTLRRAEGGKLIAAAGGDTQWVTAFGSNGARLWAVYFDSAVAAMSANAAQDRLYVACDDGTVLELDAAGKRLRSAQIEAKPTAAAPHPSAGVIVGTERGGVRWLE